MNKNLARRYKGLLIHYLRGLRSQVLSFNGAIGLGITLCLCICLGYSEISSLEPSGWFYDSNAVQRAMEMALVWANSFLLVFILIFTGIFYQPSQRREMLTVVAWPAERECFALLKLFDGYMFLVYAIAMLMPILVKAYFGCHSLEDGLRVTASAMVFFTHVFASYVFAAVFISLAGSVYIYIPTQKPRFPLFLLLWLVIGLWAVTFSHMHPPGCEPYIEMIRTGWVRFWTGILRTGPVGLIAVITVTGISLLIILRLAFTIIGISYVENIQNLEDAIMAAQKSLIAQLGELRLHYMPLLFSGPVRALWFKDIKIILRQYTTIVSVLFSLIVFAFLGFRDHGDENMLLLSLDWGSLVAVVGTTAFQMFSLPMLGIEGREGESIAPYPVTARQILLGKTLCVVSLHLPFFLFYVASVIHSGFSGDRIGSLLLWACWLFPLTLVQIAVGGWMKVRPGNPPGESSSVAYFLEVPVMIGFTALYFIVFYLAKSYPWVFFPAGCMGFLVLYSLIAGQVIRILPGLRVWGGKAKQVRDETPVSRIWKQVFKIGLASLPVFLVYLYLSAGIRPLRHSSAEWRGIFFIVPVLVALVLFKTRFSHMIRVALAGALLFVMTGAVVLHHADLRIPLIVDFLHAYPQKIYDYLWSTDENQEIRLPVKVAKQFGYDPAMSLDEICQTPPLPSGRLAEFFSALTDTDAFYKIWDDRCFHEWLAKSASDMSVSKKLDMWFNFADAKRQLRHLRHIFFNPRDVWTSEDLYYFADKVFRNPGKERFQELYMNLYRLPFKSLDEIKCRNLVQVFRDKIMNNRTYAKKLDTGLESYVSHFKIMDSKPLFLRILASLPGPDAFDILQELLHENQKSSGIIMPPREQLATGETKLETGHLRTLWQEYPGYAAFLSARHPLLSDDINAAEAIPRLTEASQETLSWIQKTIAVRGRDEDIARYVSLSGGPAAFRGRPFHAGEILCTVIPRHPGLLADLDLSNRELTALCRCIKKPLQPEDARLLMKIVEASPRAFAAEDIYWYLLLTEVANAQPDEYTDFAVNLMANGASFEYVWYPVSYDLPQESPGYQLLEGMCDRLASPRWHGSLHLRESFSGRSVHVLYALLLKYKGRDSAISFLRTVAPPLQKDAQLLISVLTHNKDTDISLLYDRLHEPDKKFSPFVQEALFRALTEKDEKDEARYLANTFGMKNVLAYVWNVPKASVKNRKSADFYLSALWYTLLFVVTSIALKVKVRSSPQSPAMKLKSALFIMGMSG